MNFSTIAATCVAVGLTFNAAAAMAEAPPRVEMRVIPSRSASRPGGANTGSSPLTPRQRPRPDILGGGGNGRGGGGGTWTDAALQTTYPNPFAATLMTSSEGIGADGVAPPDTNVAVGDSQVIEVVNLEYSVFDKTGTQLTAPLPIHTIFTGLDGMCETQDGGDPIVLFDQQAHRWFVSQLEYNSDFSSNLLCTAVSQTNDATGGWYLYEWNFGSDLPDYPKIGVWPDAYYFSANIFWMGSFFLASDACALDRNAMINFLPATGVCFSSSTPSLLPASMDGSTPPNPGAPGLYMRTNGSSALALYRFHVDFVNTNNSTFSGVSVPVAAFHLACGNGGTCVPQPGTSQQLDSLGDRLMYRLSYRNFGDHESLLVNQSVQLRSSSTQLGVRWYEIRNPFGAPAVVQQSTFAPDTARYRWMGSIAQDKQGNMLVGYSASSSSLFPSIAYSGRQAGEPLNQLESEYVSLFGTGSQTLNRWGDYSSMAIDPDDCTFWYANEYLTATGRSWQTRVESLKFPGCN